MPSKEYCEATAVNFKDARAFTFDSSYKEGMGIKSTYYIEPYMVRLQRHKGAGHNPKFDLSNVNFVPKYDRPIKIAPAKLADIRTLVDYIEHQSRPYFRAILDGQQHAIDVSQADTANDDVLDY